MNYRQVSIFSKQSLGAEGTEVMNINLKDPISRLLFLLEVTTGAGNFEKHISEALTKIELIDGSEVILSVSGSQMDAIPYFLGKPLTINRTGWEQSTTHYARLYYDFGRYLFDEKYALDPAKLNNPQLRITFDAENVESNATDVTLEVNALVFDEKVVQASNFLTTKEIKEYSPSDDSWEYTDMPTDNPYRLLLVQAYNPGKTFDDILAHIKLSEENDKRIPYDLSAAKLLDDNALHYGPVYDQAIGEAQDSARIIMSRVGKQMAVGNAAATEGNLDEITITEAAEIEINGSTAAFDLSLIISGFAPHSIASLYVGDPAWENDWYNVGGLGNLQLQLKGAGSAAANAGNPRIIVQQARGY